MTRRDVLRIVSVLALVLVSLGVLTWWMLKPGLPMQWIQEHCTYLR
ncbi:MAG: hypothetical protein NTW03_02810 [Verrucomicrobia bacterium]|nr:hypothetical protein [Verrucomicrobiota bacterium]